MSEEGEEGPIIPCESVRVFINGVEVKPECFADGRAFEYDRDADEVSEPPDDDRDSVDR